MTIKNKVKNAFRNDIFLTAFLCFILSMAALIFYIIQGDGFFIVRDDFNEQQIPFTVGLHKSILDAGINGFSWCLDLGTSSIQGYGFYELGSPFFWVSMLFPANLFPYIVGWIYMLKYAVAGVFAYLYLKLFIKDSKYAVLGSVLYAFSGFSTVNLMYYHFHDVVALFPLLLIGLERLVNKKDYRLFIFAVFINALLNYFFFIGEVIFLIIYYLFRFCPKNVRSMFKDVISCIGCGVLGVGMASVLFIPSIYYIMQSSRSTSNFSAEALLYNFRYILFNLKGLILPAESMPDMSAIFPSKFYSTGAYLPLIGLVLVFAYIIKNRNWLSRLLIFCFIGAFLPLVGNVFFLYMDSQQRWWHMFVLMMVLASCLALENISSYKNVLTISYLINLVLVIGLFIIVCFVFKDPDGASTIYSGKRFIVYSLISLIGITVTWLLLNHSTNFYKKFGTCVCLFAIITTAITLHVYRGNGKPVDIYKEQYNIATQVSLPDDQYRLNNASNVFSMANNVSGFSLFSSTNSIGIDEFEALFDYGYDVNGLNKNTYEGLAALLGGKYYIATEQDGNNVVATYNANNQTYYLLETAACPIGFTVDSFLTKSELSEIPVEYRAKALMQAAVVDDAASSDISFVKHINPADIDLDIDASTLIKKALNNSVKNFTKDGHGFRCTTDFDADKAVYFSVPYDKGWSATMDGEKLEITNSGGMILISVPEGNHTISFTYSTPGYKIGLLVSVISLIIYIALLICNKKRLRKI